MKRFVLIFFTAIFCICAARAFAEIPAAANLPTQKDFLHKLFLFEGITCAEAYPKVGLKNEKLDERVSDFLWKASAHATEQPDSRFLEELERQGRLLYLDGCDDPMMQFMYARLLLEMHNDVAAAQFFRWAAQSLGKQGYAPVWQAQAASQARKIFDGVGDKDQAQKFDPLIIDAVHAMLKSALYDNSNRDLLIAQITSIIEPLPALTRRTLWESIKDDRAIDPVALLMIEGFYEYSAAYEFHAGEADFPHADHLALAGDSFFRAWQLDESLPDAAVAMLRLAAPDDSRTWLERATTARFDDPQAYSAYMSKLTNMADHKALLEFGQECFDTARFDTEVPLIYLQTKIAARDEIDSGDISD
ncbi:MAG TPA: hypothetical protein VKK61_11600, partial [Tepidisphaeraceae bacterium]|nr:hypothetical protein [Tepidisphaeraceae bacterium]